MSEHYFTCIINPRFNETDGLGHINNTVIPVWFEVGREPIFSLFNPGLSLEHWNLIVAGFTIAYLTPTYYGRDVEIKTWVSRVGNSSFELTQQCWQGGHKTAEAKTTLVHFDYVANQSQPITDELKRKLSALNSES